MCGFVMVFDGASVNFVHGRRSFGGVHSESGCVDGEACLVEVLVDEILQVLLYLGLWKCIEKAHQIIIDVSVMGVGVLFVVRWQGL